jgi:hypothetical protein
MKIPICSNCKEQQWSAMDKKYLEIYGHCWGCDRRKWLAKNLSLEEFENREKVALNSC